MDIACPNCVATYRVPDSLLASGASLRCTACEHAWVPEVPQLVAEVPAAPVPAPPVEMAAAPAAAPEPPLEPPGDAHVPAPPRALTVPSPSPTTPPPLQRRHPAGLRPAGGLAPPSRQVNTGLRLAWLVSIMLVMLTVVTLFAFGEQIATAWPPFERVQARLKG